MGFFKKHEAFYPYINMAAWENQRHSATRRMVDHYRSPLIALGRDTPETVIFSRPDENFDELLPRALKNLRERKDRPSWTKVDVDPQTNLWMRVGDWLTSSDMIDPEFLVQTQKTTKIDRFFFSLPVREVSFVSNIESIPALMHFTAGYFLDAKKDGGFPLSPDSYFFTGNETQQGAMNMSIPVRYDLPNPIIVINGDGSAHCTFALVDEDMQKIWEQLQMCVMEHIHSIGDKHDFSGRFVVAVPPKNHAMMMSQKERWDKNLSAFAEKLNQSEEIPKAKAPYTFETKCISSLT